MAKYDYYNQPVEVTIPRRLAIKLKHILAQNPDADVEDVVRCEKCKYLQHTNNHIPYCEMWDDKTGGKYTHCIHEVSYDGFCSYGVNMDGGN